MEIAKIAELAAVTPQTAAKTTVQTAAEKTNSTLAADNADKYVKSEETFTPAYTKQSVQKKEVENQKSGSLGISVAQTKADHLSSLVTNLISHQAEKSNSLAFSKIELSDELKAQIQEATGQKIESDETEAPDYWGAEATAKRIFDFAKNLAGDDSALADTLKDAFIKGFGLAEKPYGGKGKLPEVCYETYDLVIDMFDSWKADSTEQAEAPSEEAVEAEKTADTEASAQ